ncbi:hypothetical protein D3C77_306090 [compost metagenome]
MHVRGNIAVGCAGDFPADLGLVRTDAVDQSRHVPTLMHFDPDVGGPAWDVLKRVQDQNVGIWIAYRLQVQPLICTAETHMLLVGVDLFAKASGHFCVNQRLQFACAGVA